MPEKVGKKIMPGKAPARPERRPVITPRAGNREVDVTIESDTFVRRSDFATDVRVATGNKVAKVYFRGNNLPVNQGIVASLAMQARADGLETGLVIPRGMDKNDLTISQLGIFDTIEEEADTP